MSSIKTKIHVRRESTGKALFDHSYNRELRPLPKSVKSKIENRQTAGKFRLFESLTRDWIVQAQLVTFSLVRVETLEMVRTTTYSVTSTMRETLTIEE
jgi:hypothetical protein